MIAVGIRKETSMRPISIPLLTLAAACLAGQALAQAGSGTIESRTASFDAQVERGVLTGDLTDGEANSLKAEFQDIARLEAGYRARGGPQAEDQAELQRRFAALEQRLDRRLRDDVCTDWARERLLNDAQPISARLPAIEQMLDDGVRNLTLDAAEAQPLRTELQAIRALGAADQADARLEALEQAIHSQRGDAERAPPAPRGA
jgi:hypothetical protein